MALNIQRIRTAAALASLVSVVGILSSSSAVRHTLQAVFSPTRHPFRFVSLVIAILLNAKSLPLLWHLRFLRIMTYQLHFQPSKLPMDALFRPVVTSRMYTPIAEIDFNVHKSNSAYFSDFDMARTQLISCLFRHGIRDVQSRTYPELALPNGDPCVGAGGSSEPKSKKENPRSAPFNIHLGAVSCHFKKEIKPYERFDIWTRVLCWDHKWLFTISHATKAGVITPEHFALQPALNSRVKMTARTGTADERQTQWKSAIFATSIAKYVVKRNRQTVPPEMVLNASHLLPPKPDKEPNENSKKSFSGSSRPREWTWEGVDEERVRGLRLAAHFGALDGPEKNLHDEFPTSGMPGVGGKIEVLGRFRGSYL